MDATTKYIISRIIVDFRIAAFSDAQIVKSAGFG